MIRLRPRHERGLRAAPAMLVLLLGLALVRGGTAAGSQLDRTATELVRKLELTSVAGFKLSDDVAIAVVARSKVAAVEAPSAVEPAELSRPLAGLVRARLEELGATSLFVVEAAERAADLEAVAREQGAEWLLLVRAESVSATLLRVSAELRSIDRGLWVPPPKPGQAAIYATAEEQIPIDESLRALLAVGEPDPRIRAENGDAIRLEGLATRVGSIDDRVLALAGCEAGSFQGARALYVLTPRALSAYVYLKGALRRVASLDLTHLPRAVERVREPVGAIACGENAAGARAGAGASGEIMFGTSDLKTGHVARVDLAGKTAESPEIVLRVTRAIDGIPFGYVGAGRLLLGVPERGRSRFARSVRIESRGRIAEQDLKASLLDLAIEPGAPANHRVVGLSADYRLLHFNDGLDGFSIFGTSGVGVRIVPDEKTVTLVTTSSAARRERDEVRLLSAAGGSWRRQEPVAIEGSIYATAVGSFRAPEVREVVVAAYRAALRRTDLLAIRLIAETKAKPR